MMYAHDIHFLHGGAPRGMARWLLGSWFLMLLLLILAPSLVDRLVWFPSVQWFSLTGFLLLPAVWGFSAAVQIVGLFVSSALFWFFGDDVESRMGTRRFLMYLGVTATSGFLVAFLWARFFAGHVATVAPYLAWSLAFAACRLHTRQILVWKRYALGSFWVLFYFLLISLALNLLVTLASEEPMDQAMGALATVTTSAYWFDHQWPRRVYAWWKLRRRHFGKRNGTWGY